MTTHLCSQPAGKNGSKQAKRKAMGLPSKPNTLFFTVSGCQIHKILHIDFQETCKKRALGLLGSIRGHSEIGKFQDANEHGIVHLPVLA